jgi:hypothetical protein
MRRLEDVQAWLEVPNLQAILMQARDQSEEEASLAVIAAGGISVSQWQNTREELGLPRWHFATSEQLYKAAQDSLAAGLMAVAAHSVSVNLNVAQEFITVLKDISPETRITEHPAEQSTIINALLDDAIERVESWQDRSVVDVLMTRLRKLKANTPSVIQEIVPEDAAQREVELYRYEPEARRTLQAQETTRGLLKVARHLAEQFGERLDADEITRQPRVTALTAGWWANRFAVLAALQHALVQGAPKTAGQMSAQRAFRDPVPWQELWARFPMLPRLSPAIASQQSTQQVSLLGITSAQEDLFRDLLLGSSGMLGKKLSNAVDSRFSLAALHNTHRQITTVPTKGRSRSWSGVIQTPPRHESNQDREIHGLLGEIFVYRVAGIFVRFYTLRRSVRLFNAMHGKFTDFSTGCWLLYRPSQAKSPRPGRGKRQPGPLIVRLVACLSHLNASKGALRDTHHGLETRWMSIFRPSWTLRRAAQCGKLTAFWLYTIELLRLPA